MLRGVLMNLFRHALPKTIAPFLIATLALTAAPAPTYANSYTVPKLLITEVTPDTQKVDGTTGTPDAFEFIELYNNTNSSINLRNYRIIYETPTVYNWTITTDKYIPAKGTFVVWIKSDDTATLADFNANYGTALTSSQVFTVSAAGMANTADRTISVAASDNVKISTLSYDVDDVAENIGIPYLYPTDGTNKMRKLTTDKRLASPGSVFTGQVPPATWDDIDPARPTGVTAKPGSNQVTLNWSANTESDLAFYRVYVDGVHYHTYRKETRSAVVTGLNDEQNYTFEVAAVDTSNNPSVKTAISSAPLSIPVTQQSVVGTPSGSFPEYSTFFSKSTSGPLVPALAQDLVPQGMTYAASKNWLLVSHYREDGKSSMLTAIDAATGKLVKSMTLYNQNGTPSTGHVGGIAATGTDVWVTVGSTLRRISLQDIVSVPNRGRVYLGDYVTLPAKASFAMFADGILWGGEFYEANNYPTDTAHHKTTRSGAVNHAWMVGYQIDPVTGLPTGKTINSATPATPDYVLSIPDKVQGAAVVAGGKFALSSSYGRANNSNLWFYQDVLSQSPHYYSTINGTSVPSWFLDTTSRTSALVSPPMTEGVAFYNGYLYTLFESAATQYLDGGKYPLDNIMQVNVTGL
ncbi:hypothetical protein CBW65_23545 [Tumebacillus avium]|uniref:Fibronectin type-III domain-containing protein n=2 Tax=Tumebacillus avium TaxID=1903704 RepID=A0A1Y0ITM7_9BACL|nr:hypothetical protein CBW65_23545 [Tumebacillus avium]